ncbi:hypothetical protein [Propionicicella superfundia]|uniref:hypothetical protein n=1 Tax=Propionicicella superfundia TaxID=348582 RepID=UPI0004297AD6|nr:hypothetical protein [Propionicicella superfundia]
MTELRTQPKTVSHTTAGALAPLAAAGFPSRQDPPEYRVSTPALLRYGQVALLIVGLLLGLVSVPLFITGDRFALQQTAEQEHADLSSIQTEAAKANELALTSLLNGKPDRDGFGTQMGVVAEKVAAAGRSGSVDTGLLGKVNSGLIQYTAQMNAALTADEATAGSGTSEAVAAQQTLEDDVLTNLDALLGDAAAGETSPLWTLVATWVAIGIGAVCALWLMVLVARRSRRVLNLGLIGALTVLAAGGVTIGLLSGAVSGPTQATTAHTLTAAQGQLTRVRAAELTYILAPSVERRSSVTAHLEQARALLASGADDGAAMLTPYEKGWQTVSAEVTGKDTAGAAEAATGTTGPALVTLTEKTSALVSTDRSAVVATLSAGAPVLTWMGVTMIAVGLGYLILGLIGLHARIREYR